ncbi:hypothetical protein vseg_001380 [Gypsophila vaccaria]
MTTKQVQKEAEKTLKQPQNGAQLTISNQTLSNLTFVKSIEWFGEVSSAGYPANINAGGSAMFSHLRVTNDKSKAAVVYSGTNAAMQPCAWILAWCAPAESTTAPNKVYVFCGHRTLIDSMTDDQIRVSLDGSSDTSSATDKAVNTSAHATIDESVPNRATIKANFSIIQ